MYTKEKKKSWKISCRLIIVKSTFFSSFWTVCAANVSVWIIKNQFYLPTSFILEFSEHFKMSKFHSVYSLILHFEFSSNIKFHSVKTIFVAISVGIFTFFQLNFHTCDWNSSIFTRSHCFCFVRIVLYTYCPYLCFDWQMMGCRLCIYLHSDMQYICIYTIHGTTTNEQSIDNFGMYGVI